MQINERGNKKWVSIFIPEHTRMLQNLYIELNNPVPESKTFDDQYLERINFLISESYSLKKELTIKFIKHSQLLTITGIVIKTDLLEKSFVIKTNEEEKITIISKDIVDILDNG